MPVVHLHAGIHKTGTTFLQKRLFPKLKNVRHICRENYSDPSPGSIASQLSRIAATTPLFLDLDLEKATLDRALKAVDEPTVLISMERWFGNMANGFRENLYNAQTFRYLVPDARIILTIRRQDTLLESLYRQLIRRYAYPTVDGFLALDEGGFASLERDAVYLYPSVNPRRLDLGRYVRNYARLFGRENILVLPYEKMRQEPVPFFDELCAFLDTDPVYPDVGQRVHESYSLASCRIALALNRFVRTGRHAPGHLRFIPNRPFTSYLARRPGNGPGHRALERLNQRISLEYLLAHGVDRFARSRGQLIDDERRRLIMDLHRESNRALDEEFGLGLRRYGYY